MSYWQPMAWGLLTCFMVALFVNISGHSTKLNVTLKTPGANTLSIPNPHKSIRVVYALSDEESRWIIIGIEPIIQIHRKAIERLTVHLCDRLKISSISYDDNIVCDDGRSLLIYEWTPHSSISSFRAFDGSGFELMEFKSIVLIVVYKKEKQVHKEQSGVIVFMSPQIPRLLMSTMLVGDERRHTQFSCRSSNVPRLLYAVKKLGNEARSTAWWRIYVIRLRQVRRNLIQTVVESRTLPNTSQNAIEIMSSDVFLMEDDYMLIECQNTSESNCRFLVYYMYKSRSIHHEHICQHNEYPYVFKYLPSIEKLNEDASSKGSSNSNGSSIFMIILAALLILWISTIIGCIIWRRIRGLVNFRTESASPFSSQKNNALSSGRQDNYYQRQGDQEAAMQVDIEQGAILSL